MLVEWVHSAGGVGAKRLKSNGSASKEFLAAKEL